jgi:hypothetical protein
MRQNFNKKVDSKGYAHEVSDWNEAATGNWTRGHTNYIVAKNLIMDIISIS